MSRITDVLNAIRAGDPHGNERLLALVYDELRRLAAAQLHHERPGQTLDATALVHEALMRLLPGDQSPAGWDHRGHFFAAAAQAMRRVLIDAARQRRSLKRGGAGQRVALDDVAAPDADEQLLALDEALTRLTVEDPLAARVVELHHFAGLGHEQTAEALDITVYLARQKWAFARAWLKSALAD